MINLYKIVEDPKNAELIKILYEAYQMPYEELLREMDIKPHKLNSLLEATEGLWDTPSQYSYKLTERGEVAYGIMKSRNLKMKNKKDAIKKELSERPLEKLKVKLLIIRQFFSTWMAVVKTPSAFFEKMPASGGYKGPLVFALVCYIPFAILAPVFNVFYLDVPALVLPFIILGLGAVAIFAKSLLIHAGVLIFARDYRKGFESTLRFISYAQAVVVFLWVPITGVIFSLYGIYIGIIGLVNVHKTTKLRAVFSYIGILTFLGVVGAGITIYLIYIGRVESNIPLPAMPEIPTI